MPRRPDGRIEPGQKLASAISARAWNRAQDAADIVLGERTGFGAEAGMGQPVSRVAIRIPANAIDNFQWPTGVALRVGHAIGMPDLGSRAALRNDELENFNPGNVGANVVDDEDKLAVPSFSVKWIDAAGLGLALEQFGVIEQITLPLPATEENPTTYYTMTCIVSGVFVCRAIAFGGFTDRLLGPPPFPSNNNLKPLWRPYPLMSPVGTARVLAIGAYWKVGQPQWPRVVECLVSM
jgi:hypothetical protein